MADGPIPGRHPTDYPLLHLARAAVRGHRMIAERVREHAERAAAERDTSAAALAGARQLAALPPAGGHGQ
ncbi:MAG TPA: hypothetical protein VIX86_19240 [Streptosporangiaceae bacterium]